MNQLYLTTLSKYETIKEEYESLRKRYDDLIASHSSAVDKLELSQVFITIFVQIQLWHCFFVSVLSQFLEMLNF